MEGGEEILMVKSKGHPIVHNVVCFSHRVLLPRTGQAYYAGTPYPPQGGWEIENKFLIIFPVCISFWIYLTRKMLSSTFFILNQGARWYQRISIILLQFFGGGSHPPPCVHSCAEEAEKQKCDLHSARRNKIAGCITEHTFYSKR